MPRVLGSIFGTVRVAKKWKFIAKIRFLANFSQFWSFFGNFLKILPKWHNCSMNFYFFATRIVPKLVPTTLGMTWNSSKMFYLTPGYYYNLFGAVSLGSHGFFQIGTSTRAYPVHNSSKFMPRYLINWIIHNNDFWLLKLFFYLFFFFST